MSIYHKIAEKLQFVSPNFYKERFFKKLKNLSKENVIDRNIEPELVWIRDYLENDAVILEIGANVGAYLFVLQDQLFHENIFAFEPNKKLYFRLKRLFPKMNIFPYAVSDDNTMAEFKVPIINGKEITSRGTLQTDFLEENEEKMVVQKVKVIKLDDWATLDQFLRLDFIKIDVEGNEMQTLRGAKAIIKKFLPTLMVEMEQRHHQEPLWKLILEIESWGYSAHYLDRNFFELKPLLESTIVSITTNNLKDKKNYINNIIFIPKK